jgi:predicted phage baseplate assembly protein
MTLTAPNLDDLRFQQDLVDEARKRIIRYCPEWTDYNLSDPGITLIELFAWMTEVMLYRLNRVPEKNYVKFLEMLGMQRMPASSARTELTFWLSAPLPINPEDEMEVLIPKGLEVKSISEGDEEIYFSTSQDLHILPPKLLYLLKADNVTRNYLPKLGLEVFQPFNETQPRQGDTFLLGFDPDADISGHILRLSFTTEPIEAVGIRRDDPPWVWECSMADGTWHELTPSRFQGEKNTTGGLNNPSGSLVLYLPLDAAATTYHGRNAYWLRCRIEQRQPSQGMYTESPRILNIETFSLGGSTVASHALVIRQEYLGKSSGDAGQEFTLLHAPVLELQSDETLLVEEFRNGEYVLVPWKHVTSFAGSGPFDRHFTLDEASGTVRLGQSVRQPDGSVQFYGRVPENGRDIYFSSYRYGGGTKGNLPVNTLQSMTSSIAYVSRVTNLTRASGGRDEEDLEEVKLRAQRELQAQKRAVTAQDFEQASLDFSRNIARAHCLVPTLQSDPSDLGVVRVLIVPAVATDLRHGDLTHLHVDQDLTRRLTMHLDKYRLLTTHVSVHEPAYMGVRADIKIVADDFSNPETVALRVKEYIQNFLNPLVPFPEREAEFPLLDASWRGWELGKDLFPAEVYALVQRVPGVKYVMDVEISTRPVNPRMENSEGELEETEKLEGKRLVIPENTLVCSLNHHIMLVDAEGRSLEGADES